MVGEVELLWPFSLLRREYSRATLPKTLILGKLAGTLKDTNKLWTLKARQLKNTSRTRLTSLSGLPGWPATCHILVDWSR